MKLVYIASPYTHKDKTIMNLRAAIISQIVAMLQSRYPYEYSLFSPIIHGHQLTLTNNGKSLPTDFSFWEAHCFKWLSRCDEMWIMTVPGWDKSRGVDAEIKFCQRHNILCRYVTKEGKFL